jgi:hypothetical protein
MIEAPITRMRAICASRWVGSSSAPVKASAHFDAMTAVSIAPEERWLPAERARQAALGTFVTSANSWSDRLNGGSYVHWNHITNCFGSSSYRGPS